MIEAAELQARWRQAAPRWRAHGALVRSMTAPVTRALVDALGPAPGERWLDVAGGVGDPAILVAARVGAEGRVVVTDVEPDMTAGAREAAIGGDGRVLAVAAAAEALPVRHVFDGATCRFGVMFFADPLRGMSEIRAALVPGGRAAFAIWGSPERNPYFTEVQAAVRDVVPDVPVPDPDEPHVFRFSSPGKLPALARRAGWVEVEEREVPFTMAAPIAHGELWGHLVGLSADLESLIEELPADQRAGLRAGIESRAAPYFRDGTMRMPAQARVVLARSPGRHAHDGRGSR